jgi:hypothetical protein
MRSDVMGDSPPRAANSIQQSAWMAIVKLLFAATRTPFLAWPQSTTS